MAVLESSDEFVSGGNVPTKFPSIFVAFALCFLGSLSASQTAYPQAATLLSQSAVALAGSVPPKDVTLTGSAEWIAGSTDETGTAVYRAVTLANGLTLSFRDGTRNEIRSNATAVPSGTWTGLDGVSHAMAYHNLISDPGWFPAFAIENLLSSSNTVLTYVGPETRNGASVIHISASQLFPNLSGNEATVMQHLSQVDIYFDPTTSLPVSYVFNSHPDSNALLDIPTEIRYSNYQAFGGARIPLHVQRFINGTLTLDLQFQSASLNTGLTAAQISAQ
jgi:hypothetical protein